MEQIAVPLKKLMQSPQNMFARIYNEPLPWKERQIAIFIATIQDAETWNDFEFERLPYPPSGYDEMHESYVSARNEDKSDYWKRILQHHGAFVEKRARIKADNESNRMFLNEMLEVFKANGMESYAEKVEEKLRGYYEHS